MWFNASFSSSLITLLTFPWICQVNNRSSKIEATFVYSEEVVCWWIYNLRTLLDVVSWQIHKLLALKERLLAAHDESSPIEFPATWCLSTATFFGHYNVWLTRVHFRQLTLQRRRKSDEMMVKLHLLASSSLLFGISLALNYFLPIIRRRIEFAQGYEKTRRVNKTFWGF